MTVYAHFAIPTPRSDESLHSVLIRAFRGSGYPSFGAFTRLLLGRSSDGRGWPWSYMQVKPYLSESGMAATAMLDRMLALAYYVPFMPTEALRLCQQFQSGGEVPELPMGFKPGSRALHKVHKPLRFCPACVTRDVRHDGEAYWRRAHQLAYVSACWEHRLRLVMCNQAEDSPWLPHELETGLPSSRIDDDQAWFAAASKQLLYGNHAATSIRTRSKVYRIRAIRLGYSESTSQQALCIASALQDRFGPRLLGSVFGGHDVQCLTSQVRRVIGTSAAQSAHPAAHLLCIEVLFGDLNTFFSRMHKATPLWKAEKAGEKAPGPGTGFGPAAVHRLIFLQAVKKYGASTMQRLVSEHPVCHAWILQNDRRWAASLIRAAEREQWDSQRRVIQNASSEHRRSE